MNHLSLFTGIGGLDLAAEWAGFKTVGQVEIDDYCNKVLQKHWPDVPRWMDVYELTGKEIEEKCGSISLLSGGFPCQPFSCAGKRKGTEDERYLWDELLRIICEVRPRWVVAENVRGLLSIDAGRTFGTVLSDLAENGYRVGWLCYGAGDVGAPHKRERVFIVGYSESGQSGQQETGNGGQDTCRGSEKMANANIGRGFTRGRQTDGMGVFQAGQGEPIKTHQRQGDKGAVEPGVGRVPTGISAGMDGNWPAGQWPTPRSQKVQWIGPSLIHRNKCNLEEEVAKAEWGWPAGPGEQHEWEPPRIATGIKDRVARLKCLGNAVVPQQAYPIFKAIAEYELNC